MKIRLLLQITFIALAVAACGRTKEAITPPAEIAPVQHSSPADIISQEQRQGMIQRINAEARGINVGNSKAPRTAYVFFDPMCSHCSDLWAAASVFKEQVHFVWIPVDFLGRQSTHVGAEILASPDPLVALTIHEEKTMKQAKVVGSPTLAKAPEKSIAQNRDLLLSLVPSAPITTVPFTFYVQPDRNISLLPGAMTSHELAKVLDLPLNLKQD